MPTTIFDVCNDGDESAGMRPYYDSVAITTDADPGGEPGEFAEHMRQAIAEWYDGARVTQR